MMGVGVIWLLCADVVCVVMLCLVCVVISCDVVGLCCVMSLYVMACYGVDVLLMSSCGVVVCVVGAYRCCVYVWL